MLTRRSVNDTNMKLVLTLFLVVSLLLCTAAGFLPGAPLRSPKRNRRLQHRPRRGVVWKNGSALSPRPTPREHLRILTRDPHIAGTKKTTRPLFTCAISCGLRHHCRVEGYEVWLNYPNSPSIVELITARRQRLNIHEPVVKDDPSSSHQTSLRCSTVTARAAT